MAPDITAQGVGSLTQFTFSRTLFVHGALELTHPDKVEASETMHRPWPAILSGVVWAVVGVLLEIGSAAMTAWNPFLTFSAFSVYWLVGLVLLCACLVAGLRRRQGNFAVAGGLVLGAILLLLGAPALELFGVRLAFSAHKPAYEEIVADAAKGRLKGSGRASRNGVNYQVDVGPPARVAFVWGGLLDNWSGVVFDGTDVVASARGWSSGVTGTFTATPEAQKLFGGDLVWCEELSEHYYYCSFT
jgi:hypothetical protein